MRKPRGYWTKERCQEESLKYSNRTEFQKESNGAYIKCLKNNWLDEICSHMTMKQKPIGYWTKEKCRVEVLKYDTIKELKKNGKGAYNRMIVNKWIDELCNHMGYLKQYRFRWCKEKSKIEALKYNNRSDFFKYSKGCYMASNKNNWLDEICNHMSPKGNKFNKCIYVYEFSDNFAYVGLTYNLDNRHKSRMCNKKDPVFKHIQKTNLKPTKKQLTDYINVKESIKLEKYYFNIYKENGWNMLNKNKTGVIGGDNKYWDKKKCEEEVLKYKTRKSLKENNPSLYTIIVRNKWSNEMFSHMKRLRKPNGYWTKEKCQKESLKYKTRTEFQKKDKKCYEAANKNKWLKDICNHMIELKKPKGYWTKERCLEKSLECKSRTKFYKEFMQSYFKAYREGWLDEICSHMKKK